MIEVSDYHNLNLKRGSEPATHIPMMHDHLS